MSAAAPAPLPPLLADNPRLGRWVGFAEPGRVRVATGRVEIGQGVLTAMRQIAAEELDVALDRVALLSGDTELTPNEGYTAGSQSIQFGGVALRLACAEVRALFLARRRRCWAVRGRSLGRGRRRHPSRQPTGQDYWSLAAAVDLGRHASGRAMPKPARGYRVVGPQRPARRSRRQGVRRAGLCPRHGARRHAACTGRAPAAPRRDDPDRRRGRFAPRGQGADRDRPRRQFPRHIRSRRNRSSKPSRRSRQTMWCGTTSTRSTRFRKRRAGCCSSPRSTGLSAPRNHPPRHRRQAATRRPTPACTSPTLRWRRLAAWPCFATGGSGVDAFARGLPAARGARPHVKARSGDDLGQPRAGAGLLRPQRRR